VRFFSFMDGDEKFTLNMVVLRVLQGIIS